MSGNLTFQCLFQIFRPIVTLNFGWCIDVRQISSNSRRVDDIVEWQLSDQWTLFQQQTQWLANAAWKPYGIGIISIIALHHKRFEVITWCTTNGYFHIVLRPGQIWIARVNEVASNGKKENREPIQN